MTNKYVRVYDVQHFSVLAYIKHQILPESGRLRWCYLLYTVFTMYMWILIFCIFVHHIIHVHIYINTAVTLWYCIRIFVTFVHNGGVSFLSFFYTFILHSIMKNFIATVTSPISKMRRRRRARPAAPIKINLKQQVK